MQTELAPSAQRRSRSRHVDSWVYFDGEIVRYHDVHLGPMTHALHYGTGCFEGIRAYWNAAQQQLYVLQAEAHFDRLRRSASILRLSLPGSSGELTALTVDVLSRNEARTDTYIRPLVFICDEVIGVSLHNLQQSFLIYTAQLREYLALPSRRRCVPSSRRARARREGP